MESLSFKLWLFELLVSDGAIDEEDYPDEEDFTEDTIIETEDLDESELDTYAMMYLGECTNKNITPDFSDFEATGERAGY